MQKHHFASLPPPPLQKQSEEKCHGFQKEGKTGNIHSPVRNCPPLLISSHANWGHVRTASQNRLIPTAHIHTCCQRLLAAFERDRRTDGPAPAAVLSIWGSSGWKPCWLRRLQLRMWLNSEDRRPISGSRGVKWREALCVDFVGASKGRCMAAP